MSTGTYWIEPPEKLAENIVKYGERVLTAVYAVAVFFAQLVQNEMRQNAPWTDRTGNARSGLFSQAERAARDVVEIYLSHGHSIEYGEWLEFSRGGKYAIIMPTIERNLATLEKMLDDLFRD